MATPSISPSTVRSILLNGEWSWAYGRTLYAIWYRRNFPPPVEINGLLDSLRVRKNLHGMLPREQQVLLEAILDDFANGENPSAVTKTVVRELLLECRLTLDLALRMYRSMPFRPICQEILRSLGAMEALSGYLSPIQIELEIAVREFLGLVLDPNRDDGECGA